MPGPQLSHRDSPALLGPDVATVVVDSAAIVLHLSASELPTISEPTAPPVVPGYRVVRELGRGGMGVVYEAEHLGTGRAVALKVLPEELSNDPAAKGRYRDEAEAVARLDHPNVVRVYEVGEHDDRPYLALELVRGATLAHRLAAGPLPVAAAVAVVRAVALAVQHAHDRGVVHRDLKPGNILLDWGSGPGPRVDEPPVAGAAPLPTPRVTDFGLARFLDRDLRRTRSGLFVGTPSYVAPEIADRRAAAPAADVWALGVLLYECLTGHVPFEAPTFVETIRLAAAADPPPIARHRPGLPRGLDTVCRKALAKLPADRYASAQAFADDLDRFAAGCRVRALSGRPLRFLRAGVVKRAAGVALIAAVAVPATSYWGHYRAGTDAMASARSHLARGAYHDAEAEAEAGLRRVGALPGLGEMGSHLGELHRAAKRGRLTGELHRVIDRLRFEYDAGGLSDADLRGVAAACDALWVTRHQFLPARGRALDPAREAQLHADLLDLALLTADYRVREARGASADGQSAARTAAVQRLTEASELLSRPPILDRVRDAVQSGGDVAIPDAGPNDAATAWELYALGRYRLHAGDADGAAPLLRRAVEWQPDAFWPNFYSAVAALRRNQPDEAVSGFSVCLAVAPGRRGLCHYNRAAAHEARGAADDALRDFDRALELEPDLAAAAFRRGLLRHRLGRLDDAAADLERAVRGGYDPAAAWYRLALVREAAGDLPAATAAAAEAVRHDPTGAQTRGLLARLRATTSPTEPTSPRRSAP